LIRQVQNSQESLFNTSVDELLKQYKITPAIVTGWYKSGYLSFDPPAYDELNNRQEIEFHFIGSLFKSELSLTSVESLLARLEKPYCYNLQSVYFDFMKNDWEYQLRIPEVEEQIEELIDNEENNVLLEIKDQIEEYLDGLDENEE
jgi:hypothetical protein